MKSTKSTKIYRPEPRLSDLEKRLIKFLCQLLLDFESQQPSSRNFGDDCVVLTDYEAERLLNLVAALLAEERFWRTLQYTDLVTSPERHDKKLNRTLWEVCT